MKKIVIAAVVLAAFGALIAWMLMQTEAPGGASSGKGGDADAAAPDESATPEKAREAAAKKGRPRAEETAPALAVSGVVKSADGRPLAGASVEAYAVPAAQDIPDDERAGRALLTKRFGGETAERILASTKGLRAAVAGGNMSNPGDAMGAGMEAGLEMLTDDGGGELLSSVMRIGSEMLLAQDGDWVRAGSATTDGSGAFRIEEVPAGRIELRAKAPSFVKAKQRVNAGESGVTISLQPGVRLTGTVTSEGKPLDGADVVIRGARTQTAGGGRFEFDAAHAPAETMLVSAPACVTVGMIVQIALDAPKDVTVDLEPACTVTGHVSALGGGPIAGAQVATAGSGNLFTDLMGMANGGGKIEIPPPPALSDVAGVYELTGVKAGQAKLRFEADGYLGANVSVTVKKGERGTADAMLVRESVLSGTVRDERGSGVAGARVRVEVPPRDQATGMIAQFTGGVFRSATTDASGAFTVNKLTTGDRKVRVKAEGFLDIEERIEIPAQAAATHDFVLHEGLRLAGSVSGPDGKPVAGAKVTIKGKAGGGGPFAQLMGGGPSKPAAESGADGKWSATGLQEGPYTVTAGAAGFLDAETKGVAPGSTDVALTLRAAATIRGRIVSAADGQPVAGATVTRTAAEAPGARPRRGGGNPFARMMGGRGGDASTLTAADGTFEMTSVEAGAYEISAQKTGLADSEPVAVTCVAGDVVAGIEIRMTPGVSVTGRVVEKAGGAAVIGAIVWAAEGDSQFGSFIASDMTGGDPQAPPGSISARTDANGRFVLEGLSPGKATVEVRAPQHASASASVTAPATEVVVEISVGGGVEGRATATDGTAVAGAQVMATRGMGMMGGARQTKTDASGSYRFDHLPPGSWQLMMLDPQNPMVPSGMASVTVKDGEVVRHDFTKKVGNRTVGGGALRDGKPLANVPVILMGGSGGMKMATTGDDGRFSFDGLEAGEYTVLVQSAMLGGGSASKKVKVGAEGKVEDVSLELTSMAVEGDVVDAEGGKPVAGAQVSLLDAAAGGKIGSGEDLISQYRGQAMADERGHFVIKDVQAGSFTLRVSAQGFSAATMDGVAAGTRNVRVQLQRGVEFPVTVTGPDGRPLQGATVQSVDASGRESLSMDMTLSGITSQDGVAHLRLMPGTYRINVNAPNLLPASADVDTAAGAASIRLSAGATVEVTVKNADGLLVANAKVKVLDAAGAEIKQGFTVASFMGGGDVTNADGLFTRGGLPAGAATIVVTDPAGREARAEAMLVADRTTKVDVTVK